MNKIIDVVFTNNKITSPTTLSKLRRYSFICNDDVKIGDLISNSIYNTVQVVNIWNSSNTTIVRDGRKIELVNFKVDKVL